MNSLSTEVSPKLKQECLLLCKSTFEKAAPIREGGYDYIKELNEFLGFVHAFGFYDTPLGLTLRYIDSEIGDTDDKKYCPTPEDKKSACARILAEEAASFLGAIEELEVLLMAE